VTEAVWTSFAGIALAVGLSLVMGLEREFHAKAAGMRTYTLVGMGSALYTVISKYGFIDSVAGDWSRFDGSRVAAQVVTGIGFLGAGLIFVRRDAVHGLTTAAGIWFVAAVGMAAGAGMYVLATAVTALYLCVMVGIRPISHRMPHASSTSRTVAVRYLDGHGVLRHIMETISREGLKVVDVEILNLSVQGDGRAVQEVQIGLEGSPYSVRHVDQSLWVIPGVEEVGRATTSPDNVHD